MSYYTERLAELGLDDDALTVQVLTEQGWKAHHVLTEHEQGIAIVYPTLDGGIHSYHVTEKKSEKAYTRIRYAVPPQPGRKYHTPRGAGMRLFLPPRLVRAYNDGEQFKSLIITEGEFKALKACQANIPTVGIQGIHCIAPRDADGKYLWPDVARIIERCGVKNLMLLFDADAHQLREKDLEDEVDLFTRLNSFYTAARTFMAVAKDLPLMGLYAGHLVTPEKGIDDLLCARSEESEQIRADVLGDSKGRIGKEYFRWQDLGQEGLGKLQQHFGVRDPQNFYDQFGAVVGNREFVYREGRYQYDEEKGKLELKLDPEALQYLRIGTKYFKKRRDDPNRLVPWSPDNITTDHGKPLLKMVPRYDGFECFPRHEDYQRVVMGFYNTYARLPHEPAPGPYNELGKDCPYWLAMLGHLFRGRTGRGTQKIDLILDYLQILYLYPEHKLPIICLVSKLQNTGKSTLPQALRRLFGENVTQCSNQDFESEFNDDYASKLLIYIDEAFIEKRIVKERIKRLATEKTIKVNGKGVAKYEQAFHAKFIFCSNNEDNFLQIEDTDNRFWVERVQPLERDLPNLLEYLSEEAPALLWHLRTRALVHGRSEGRMWFHPELYRTEAFAAAVEASKSNLQKAVEDMVKDMMLLAEEKTIKMDSLAVLNQLQARGWKNTTDGQIREVLKKNMGLIPTAPINFTYPVLTGTDGSGEPSVHMRQGKGRCYLFEASNLMSADELRELDGAMAKKKESWVNTQNGPSVPTDSLLDLYKEQKN
jgi:hypothetical protein